MTNPPRQGSDGLPGPSRAISGAVQIYRFVLEAETGVEVFEIAIQATPQRWKELSADKRIRVAVEKLREYRPFAAYRIVHIETTLPNV